MFDDLNLWVGGHACELLAHTALTEARWNACTDPKGFGQEVMIFVMIVLILGSWGSSKLPKTTSNIPRGEN